MGAAGTASWAYERKGQIKLAKKAASEEQLFDVALGAGAEDIAVEEGEEWLVTTPGVELDVVRKALEEARIEVKSAQLAMIAKNLVSISGRDADLVTRLVENLDDHDDVQNIWSNFDLSDEEIARLSGG